MQINSSSCQAVCASRQFVDFGAPTLSQRFPNRSLRVFHKNPTNFQRASRPVLLTIESMLLSERIKALLAPPGAVYVARRRSAGLIAEPAQWSAISAVSGNLWLGQTLSAQRARRDDMVRSGQNRLSSGPLLISERNRTRLCAFRSPRLAATYFTDGDCRALPCQQ